jgi:hypothetical protein
MTPARRTALIEWATQEADTRSGSWRANMRQIVKMLRDKTDEWERRQNEKQEPDHEHIWLEPVCAKCAGKPEGRLWCQDNVWPDGCEDCGKAPTRYVIAAPGD